MFIDNAGWGATSSFNAPITPIGANAGCAPIVTVWYNAAWLQSLLGALQQLTQPTTWATIDPTILANALGAATDLIAIIGVAGATSYYTPILLLNGNGQPVLNGNGQDVLVGTIPLLPLPILNGDALCHWVVNGNGAFIVNN